MKMFEPRRSTRAGGTATSAAASRPRTPGGTWSAKARRAGSAGGGPDVTVQPPLQRCRGAQDYGNLVRGLAGIQPRRHRPLPPADQALEPEQFKPGMVLGISAGGGLE